MRRWEFIGDGSARFWEGAADGPSVTVRYGRAGAQGRTQVTAFDSAQAAARHFAEAAAAKERKGYREVGPLAAEGAAGSGAPTAFRFPDETAFSMPHAWRRQVYPRRGGIEQSAAAPAAGTEQMVERRLKEEADWVEQMLAAPTSDQQIVAATRAHLSGSPSPLGAAALATLTMHWELPDGVFVDAWVRGRGLPFAARAVVAAFELQPSCTRSGGRRSDPRIAYRPATDPVEVYWTRSKYADRARELIAQADEETYRATVAALAGCRTGTRSRIVACYLAPTEREWVDEACQDPAACGTDDPVLMSMLLCSLGSPEQLARIDRPVQLTWDGWTLPVIATLAEGVGAACAPLLGEGMAQAYGWERLKVLADALVELPTDEAFALLAARMDDKYVRSALLEAMRRYPVRALRLLGAAACGPGKNASMARRLLTAHVPAHRTLSAAALPELPAEVAALVDSLAPEQDRGPDASPDALPAVLVDPPWLRRRTVRKPRTLAGLRAADEPRTVWLTGEQERWLALGSWYSPMTGPVEDWEKEATALTGRQWGMYSVGRLLMNGPVEVLTPFVRTWVPEHRWNGEQAFKPIVARYGLAALPLARRLAVARPTGLAQLLLPLRDLDTARLMADWLVRLKSVGQTARSWFARHGLDAARLLVPDAVGETGAARSGAEHALRLIASTHGAEGVLEAAAAYGPEAAEIVGELLSADPLETALPARIPTAGAWADPALLPQILLARGGALPAAAVRHLLTMLALSRPGDVYPGLGMATAGCDPESLAAFAWALFEQWRVAGMPAKDSWALHALGWLGDDGTVRRLTPILRSWPGQGAHRRAVEGLTVLAEIGTDIALLHLHGIAQQVTFKALKTRAQEKIAEVADGLGLTGEQLSDRLVPDLGLDAEGTTVIDYGPRRFTVGFDEQLRPYVLDADGKRRKDLPVPGARDDTELASAGRKRFSALKKDVRMIASDQVRRLEAAMVAQRSWTAPEFGELLVGHPLMGHLVRRLVWLCEADGRCTAFRVAQDRTFADVGGDELPLPEDAVVRLAHPLLLGGEREAWAELFADDAILQPFAQLGRPVPALTEEEAGDHRLRRFEGSSVPVGRLLGLQRRGWVRGEPQDAGVERWFSKPLADHVHLVVQLDEGIAVGAVDVFPDQVLSTIWLDDHPGDYRSGREYPLRFGELDPVIVSELLADLIEVSAG